MGAKTITRKQLQLNRWYSVKQHGWFPIKIDRRAGVYDYEQPFPYKMGQGMLLVAVFDDQADQQCAVKPVNAEFEFTRRDRLQKAAHQHELATKGPRTYLPNGGYKFDPHFVSDPAQVEKAKQALSQAEQEVAKAMRRARNWKLVSIFDYSEQQDVDLGKVLMWMIVEAPAFSFNKKALENAYDRVDNWEDYGLSDTFVEKIPGKYKTATDSGVVVLNL